jgi:WD40 repeat protein
MFYSAGHEGAITGLSVFNGWSPSSEGIHKDAFKPFVVSCSEDKTVRVWSLINPGTCLVVLRGPEFDVLSVSVFFPYRQKELGLLLDEPEPTGAALGGGAVGGTAGAASVAAASSVGGHRSVLDPAFAVDVDFIIAAGGMDDCVHLWSYSPQESHSAQLLQVLTHSQPSNINVVECFDSKATGPIVLAGTANAEILVWSLVGPRYSLLAAMNGHSDEIQSLSVYQAEGGYAFAVSFYNYVEKIVIATYSKSDWLLFLLRYRSVARGTTLCACGLSRSSAACRPSRATRRR